MRKRGELHAPLLGIEKWHERFVRSGCRDLLSASAAGVRAGVQTMEREEAPVDDRMGLDQHRAQITADWIDTTRVRSLGRGWLRRIGRECAGSCRAFAASSSRRRLRRRPDGGSWPRSLIESVRGCIWPSRRTRRGRAVRSGGRRATGRTLGICASCCRSAGCRNRGSHLVISSIGAAVFACAIRSASTGASGSSAYRRSSATTVVLSGRR
jgi:hypothetical protein